MPANVAVARCRRTATVHLTAALLLPLCSFSFVGQQKRAAASYEDRLASVHDKLANIGQQTFARMRRD